GGGLGHVTSKAESHRRALWSGSPYFYGRTPVSEGGEKRRSILRPQRPQSQKPAGSTASDYESDFSLALTTREWVVVAKCSFCGGRAACKMNRVSEIR